MMMALGLLFGALAASMLLVWANLDALSHTGQSFKVVGVSGTLISLGGIVGWLVQ